MKKLFPFLLVLVFVFLACTAESPIVGTWVVEEYSLAGERNEMMEGKETVFNADGTVSGFIGEGTYELIEDKVLCKVKNVVDIEVEMKLMDGKLIVENPATKIVYTKK